MGSVNIFYGELFYILVWHRCDIDRRVRIIVRPVDSSNSRLIPLNLLLGSPPTVRCYEPGTLGLLRWPMAKMQFHFVLWLYYTNLRIIIEGLSLIHI